MLPLYSTTESKVEVYGHCHVRVIHESLMQETWEHYRGQDGSFTCRYLILQHQFHGHKGSIYSLDECAFITALMIMHANHVFLTEVKISWVMHIITLVDPLIYEFHTSMCFIF